MVRHPRTELKSAPRFSLFTTPARAHCTLDGEFVSLPGSSYSGARPCLEKYQPRHPARTMEMKKMATASKKYLTILVILATFSQQAFAYLDPGTGSMILQGIIAGIAVAGFTIKNYWYRLRAFFGKSGSTSLLDDEDKPEESD